MHRIFLEKSMNFETEHGWWAAKNRNSSPIVIETGVFLFKSSFSESLIYGSFLSVTAKIQQ